MPKFSGNCLCGKVKFFGDADITVAPNCHCIDCQRASGAVYATMLFVSEEKINIEGTPETFHYKADSGASMEKNFCGNCGSQLYGRNSNRPGILSLRAGVINEKDLIKPTVNVFVSSKVLSTPINDKLPAHSKMPT